MEEDDARLGSDWEFFLVVPRQTLGCNSKVARPAYSNHGSHQPKWSPSSHRAHHPRPSRHFRVQFPNIHQPRFQKNSITVTIFSVVVLKAPLLHFPTMRFARRNDLTCACAELRPWLVNFLGSFSQSWSTVGCEIEAASADCEVTDKAAALPIGFRKLNLQYDVEAHIYTQIIRCVICETSGILPGKNQLYSLQRQIHSFCVKTPPPPIRLIPDYVTIWRKSLNLRAEWPHPYN